MQVSSKQGMRTLDQSLEELVKRGLVNLDDAMNKLNYSRSLKQVMGSRFVEAFMAVKEEEQVQYRKVISSWEREFLLLNV